MGVGTGENLNEHVLGAYWPRAQVRQEMLAEAITILRLLWRGEMVSEDGKYFTIEQAQLFTVPDTPPPVMVAAAARRAAELAGSLGDGLISTEPDGELVSNFRAANGGAEKPCYGQMTVCWAPNEDEARKTAREWWPVAAVPGSLMSELSTPQEFEAVVELVSEDAVAQQLVIGPDPEKYLEKIQSYRGAGFDHIYLHQVGPEQEGFFRFCEREILPKID